MIRVGSPQSECVGKFLWGWFFVSVIKLKVTYAKLREEFLSLPELSYVVSLGACGE